MHFIKNQALAAVADLQDSRVYRVAFAMLSMALMLGLMAAPSFAQDNPFTEANDELLQYGTYGLVAGGVILGVIVGVRAGKAIYKTLSS